MNPPSEDTGESLAVMGDVHPARLAGQQASGTNGTGRHARTAAVRGPVVVRAPARPDYRLRSLDTEAGRTVPTLSTRMDGQRTRHRSLRRVASMVAVLAVVALAALVLNTLVVQPFSVPGNAMTPTFRAGDRILVARPGVLPGPIGSGQIVVFRPRHDLPCSVAGSRGGDLVRRVVAVPGDTIWSVGNTIFVDGRPLRDSGWFDSRFGQLGSTPIVSTRLGPGQYYVLADNRSDACDSRAFGPVARSSVIGGAMAIVGRDGHVFLRRL